MAAASDMGSVSTDRGRTRPPCIERARTDVSFARRANPSLQHRLISPHDGPELSRGLNPGIWMHVSFCRLCRTVPATRFGSPQANHAIVTTPKADFSREFGRINSSRSRGSSLFNVDPSADNLVNNAALSEPCSNAVPLLHA